jgi:predicted TIM-barrel fold metal-dependent hydrolase
VWVNPFHEDDLTGLIKLIGADRIMFGSDFPHPEGLARPAEFADDLDGLDDSTKAGIMGGNLRDLLAMSPVAA